MDVTILTASLYLVILQIRSQQPANTRTADMYPVQGRHVVRLERRRAILPRRLLPAGLPVQGHTRIRFQYGGRQNDGGNGQHVGKQDSSLPGSLLL